jgi:hypothetical protein
VTETQEIWISGWCELRSYTSEKTVLRFTSYATDEGLPLDIQELVMDGPDFDEAKVLQICKREIDWIETSPTQVAIWSSNIETILTSACVTLRSRPPDESDFRRIITALRLAASQDGKQQRTQWQTIIRVKHFVREELHRAKIRADHSPESQKSSDAVISMLNRVLNKLEE